MFLVFQNIFMVFFLTFFTRSFTIADLYIAISLVSTNLKGLDTLFTDLEYLWKIVVLDKIFDNNPLLLSLKCIEKQQYHLKTNSKIILNHIAVDCVMMKIVILIRPYFLQYTLILILFHLSNTSDIT